MTRDLVIDKITKIVCCYTKDDAINTSSILTSSPHNLEPRELAACFIDIESEFRINLDELFNIPFVCSIDGIANTIISLS